MVNKLNLGNIKIKILLSVIIVLCHMAEAWSNGRLIDIPSVTLFKMGEKYKESKSDSAMICFSIVESRYSSDMTNEEKILCIDALINKWQIYYYKNYDFASAYECLSKAEEIADEGALAMPIIPHMLGVLYQNISVQCNDMSAAQLAFRHYRNAFSTALAVSDTTIIDVLASNIVNLASILDSLMVINDDWQIYKRTGFANPSLKYKFNIKMHEGMTYFNNNEYDKCIAVFDTLLTQPPADGTIVRYRVGTLINQASAYKAKGDYISEKRILLDALSLADLNSMKDARIEILGLLAQCSINLGDSIEALIYDNKSLRLNDSLINYSQLSRLEGIKSGRNIRKYNERLLIMESQKNMHKIIISISTAFLLIMGLLIFLLVKRNRRLQKSNKVLYSKNMEILRQSEEERRMHKSYEQQIEGLMKVVSGTLGNEEKYKGSTLNDSRKTELDETVAKVMDSIDEWQSPDFTIERLAELCGAKSKQLSQVINEKRGCNFNSFVNEYRIREACRRINDVAHYGNLTLDAISKGVGFRARSSFIVSFKCITGLTPSEFQKIAKSKYKNKTLSNI